MGAFGHMINIKIKIRIYRNYCLFGTLIQILVKYPILKIFKSPKRPKIISLRLGGGRAKKLKTS